MYERNKWGILCKKNILEGKAFYDSYPFRKAHEIFNVRFQSSTLLSLLRRFSDVDYHRIKF